MDSSSELVATDTSQRGWALLTLTPSRVESQFRYVSTVLSRQYSVSESPVLKAFPGTRKFGDS